MVIEKTIMQQLRVSTIENTATEKAETMENKLGEETLLCHY